MRFTALILSVFLVSNTQAGVISRVEFPRAFSTQGLGVNDSIDAAGQFVETSGGSGRGFVRESGSYREIAGSIAIFVINDLGHFVGANEDNTMPYYDGSTLTSVMAPGATETTGLGISNDGTLIVGQVILGGVARAFIRDGGAWSFPTTPGFDLITARGANNNRLVVGLAEATVRVDVE